ncbi:hypothetical protein P3T76_005908 [Phytophthora citrophthora]|uniref:Uncharacterized protein n=1 Tax=Phytophthora citrophthora TaxID=4793 RepID=A0AAD9GPW4_9STRA|nr:hypothetical protein P3T76_005908 [Phytophthora citrophthora]
MSISSITTAAHGSSTASYTVSPYVTEASCIQELVQRGHVVDQVRAALDDYLTSVVKDNDALLVAPGTKLPRELLRIGAKSKLQLVAVPSTAIPSEDIDLMEATNQGVMLLQLESKQVGDRSSVEAEIGLSLLIQLARHLPRSMRRRALESRLTGSNLLEPNWQGRISVLWVLVKLGDVWCRPQETIIQYQYN